MVQVRGTVHDVSDNPDRVEKIIVRAVEPRMHGTTYITEEPTQFPVVDGVLDFNVLPGPCVVAFLRNHGATSYEKLLVPDVAEATFRECLDAAALAEEGTQSALEKVVRQIQDELAKAAPLVDEMRSLRTDVSNDRAAVDGFTKAAKASASDAASSQSKAKTSETNAKTSETNAASSAASAKSQQESAKTHFNNTVKEAEKAANSATAAKTSETNAASSASASASSAASSKTQADKSAASATQAASARDAANTSETNAAGSAAAAKTSETNSKQHETNAGDYAAVATTAATEAVDAMERATEITGGDFATRKYVDDTSTSAANSAVSKAFRVDTSVGTRVFVGNQMIYGDTGRRLLASWDAEGNVTGNMPEGLIPTPGVDGYVAVRRENNLVTMYIRGGEASQNIVAVRGLGFGYSPVIATWELAFCRIGTNTEAKNVLARLGAGHVTFSGLSSGDRFGDHQYHVVLRWAPVDDWPTGLPGTPA